MLRTSLKLIFCTAIIGSACSSTGPKVVERLEGYDDTPEWATGAKVMWSEEEDMFFANITTMAENTRPDAKSGVSEFPSQIIIIIIIHSINTV